VKIIDIYKKYGKKGTENLNINCLINQRSWGIKLEEDEIVAMAEDYVSQFHPNKTIEILRISTKEEG